MYAIVDIAGQQFKVEKDQKVFVHRIEGEEGSNVDFDKVLLIDNDKNVIVGKPVIEGAVVSARILGHVKGDKVIVFKKKRRKGYQKSNGHRQYMSQIVIENILEKGGRPKPAAEKKETAPKAEKQEGAKTEAKKETAATKAATGEKKAPAEKKASTTTKKSTESTTAKKTAAAKPAEKKTAAKKPAAKKTDGKKEDKDTE